MKKKKKDKNNLFAKEKPTKRIKKNKKKAKRLPKKVKSPFKVIIRDWGDPLTKHKEKELNETSKLEFHIDGKLYTVAINKENRCLEFGTHEQHLYLQPISVHHFLVKANTSKKK